MKWSRFLGVATFMSLGVSAWACGDDAGSGTGSASCPADDPTTDTDESACKALATVSSGLEAVKKRGCPACHGDDMSGSVQPLVRDNIPKETVLGEAIELYPPNLTPDTTGVATPDKGGRWTDDALALAIRAGIDEESQALCPQMQHFSKMSDFEVYSIVAYLRSLPAVSKNVPRSVCPPTKTKDQQ